jgi:hypothetical protein
VTTAPIVSATTTKGYWNGTTTGSRTSTSTPVQVTSNAAVGNALFGWEGVGVMAGVLGFVGGVLREGYVVGFDETGKGTGQIRGMEECVYWSFWKRKAGDHLKVLRTGLH